MKSFRLTITLLALLSFFRAESQLIVTDPVFPQENQGVVITFDATQGSGGLEGYSGDVYAHTGVLTNESSSPSNWRYVVADWGVNVDKAKMERIGEDLYQLYIYPSIREYYGVPETETIEKMAFVFRSASQVGGNWLEGKTSGGGDIFVDLYESGLNLNIIHPDLEAVIVELNDTIPIEAQASESDSIAMFVDDVLAKKVAGNILTDSLIADQYGKTNVRIIAENASEFVADSFYYYVRPEVVIEEMPENTIEGINVINDNTAILCLYAPYKEYAFAIGDFSNWEVDNEFYMKQTPDGKHFWVELNNLEPNKEYIFQYFVDGELLIGDPYAEKTSDPWNDHYITESIYPGILPYPEGKTSGIATVFSTTKEEYNWNITDFNRPDPQDLIIYELLIRDFTSEHTYQSLIDTIDYLKSLGINAIELMPVNEFEGNISWGYNPSYYFAPDKYYGPKNGLKHFIDVCHENDIAVILDMVLNHSFGQSPMVMLYWDDELSRPAENNPWYNPVAKHDFNVGYDFNHESEDTKRFVDRVVKFWIDEYKVDGYRFDLSKGFTQNNTLGNTTEWGKYDASRIAIWKRYADTIRAADANTYIILEHFADNDEEKELSEYGMMLWGNSNYNYNEAAMGWLANSNFDWISYQERGWADPRLVGYMESHDEERLMYRNITYGRILNDYSTKDTSTALQRMEQAAAFFFTIPGPKMIWQFGELGYDYTIEYNGRTGPKPIRWDYYSDYRRKYLYDIYSTLIELRQEEDVFSTQNFDMYLYGGFKRIRLSGVPMSAVVLGNFDVEDGYIEPEFYHTGKWYDYISGDSLNVLNLNQPIFLSKGEYRIYTDIRLEKPQLNTGIFNKKPVREQLMLDIYPNPASGAFYVSLDAGNTSEASLRITDLRGRLVYENKHLSLLPGSQTLEIDRPEGLIQGVYIISIITDDSLFSGRLILD